MSATARPRSQQPRTGGCLKCGEKGHWARDCAAPREKWINQQQSQRNDENPPDQTDQGHHGTQLDAEPGGIASVAIGAKPKPKRPNLTFDTLKTTKGLPEVYHNFPELFARTARGRGHEVSDLRRLLELYKRWGDRLYPYCGFDQFIVAAENLSRLHVVKNEVQSMRVEVLKGVDEMLRPPVVPLEPLEVGEENDEHGDDARNAGGDIDAIDSDEELLELAAAQHYGIAAASGAAEEIDDEELLELAGAAGGTEDGHEDIDDDELLELAMQK